MEGDIKGDIKAMKYQKYLPNLGQIYRGMFIIIIGMLLVAGGSFGIKASPESEPQWIEFPIMDTWVCLIVVWFGLDELLFRGKATEYIVKKTIAPVLKVVLERSLGEDKLRKIEKALAKLSGKKEEVEEDKVNVS